MSKRGKPTRTTKSRYPRWLLGIAVAIVMVAIAYFAKTPEQQQKECERICAPQFGRWAPSPDFPKDFGRKGKTFGPMVCLCHSTPT